MEKKKTREPILTQAIIDLHERGYCEDFMPIGDGVFSCTGNKSQFSRSQVTVHVYQSPLLEESQKVLCLVESCDGTKGMMLLTANNYRHDDQWRFTDTVVDANRIYTGVPRGSRSPAGLTCFQFLAGHSTEGWYPYISMNFRL
ncbi:hypothetical protein [Mucilaginibacter sp.]|uniref:hypothetical protein n=1 Tax=Mucilaginibacter sp. TaxID=1882438 RepID=UPI0026080970|nr:hypothetical protein [Mucilaginibacter sp.]MDB4922936.1 hypothetical protein [Mucilaginibacter sp.]